MVLSLLQFGWLHLIIVTDMIIPCYVLRFNRTQQGITWFRINYSQSANDKYITGQKNRNEVLCYAIIKRCIHLSNARPRPVWKSILFHTGVFPFVTFCSPLPFCTSFVPFCVKSKHGQKCNQEKSSQKSKNHPKAGGFWQGEEGFEQNLGIFRYF